MDKRIGILHLSDIHASEKSRGKIQRLVESLKKDLTTLQSHNNVEIKMICVSGDIINSGDNADIELNIALDDFLQPIMNALGLDENSVFVVAGNHEVKRKDIVPYVESGLESELKSETKIEEFMYNIDSESIKRIQYFDNDFSSLFGGTAVWSNPLARAYMLPVGELKIGISCINSAWRSTGVGDSEKRKMIVGRKQIIDSFEEIKTADIKICMLHHPFDWLVDDDKNAIEKCINEYDIILTGHIHESDTRIYTSFNGQSLFNTCGKFDATSDIYNGYTLIAINPYNKDCEIMLRQYMMHPRNCFDAAIHLSENGVFTTKLGNKDDRLALAYNILHAIDTNFIDFANSCFVSNVAAGKILKNFNESFIAPEFSRYSEYEKETQLDSDDANEEIITLENICNGKSNIVLLGKKEIGKTTTLHYITKHCMANFNALKTVPIIINTLLCDFSGKNVIVRAAHKFIMEYCDETEAFSLADIESLLSAGLCTVMFDNFETAGERELGKINEFLEKYPNNKFIFAEKEDVSARGLREIAVVPRCKYDTVHFCSLTKSQIRFIANQNILSEDSSSLVDKILLCFKKTTLPKTPFVLSLILSICRDTSDFAPINEAVVMEQFMELLLKKTSPTEAYSTTFDFRIKEDFLIFLVSYMDEQNKFYLEYAEFDDLLLRYHENIGFTVKETKFDTLFINNGVLIRTELIVTFRYNCMIDYYLAKKAEQSSGFLSHILENENFLNYADTLLYYTGLNRKSIDVVVALQEKLHRDIERLKDVIKELENYNIGLNISIPEKTFAQQLENSKLSQAQSDKIQDTKDTSESNLPENIDKQASHEEMDAFVQTLLIYGSCLKNLELIPKQQKERIYADYILGLCIMLGILKKNMEDFFNSEISDMEKVPDKYSTKDVKHFRAIAQDIIKIALPLAVQNIALENVGTTKLSSIIQGYIDSKNDNEFALFFSVFLYSDLRLKGLKGVLQKYISDANNKSLLKIIFFKLLFYYRFGYFSTSLDPFLVSTLADINLRLQGGNGHKKAYIIQTLKDEKRHSFQSLQ